MRHTADIAQLAEHLPFTKGVPGSNPGIGSIAEQLERATIQKLTR